MDPSTRKSPTVVTDPQTLSDPSTPAVFGPSSNAVHDADDEESHQAATLASIDTIVDLADGLFDGCPIWGPKAAVAASRRVLRAVRASIESKKDIDNIVEAVRKIVQALVPSTPALTKSGSLEFRSRIMERVKELHGIRDNAKEWKKGMHSPMMMLLAAERVAKELEGVLDKIRAANDAYVAPIITTGKVENAQESVDVTVSTTAIKAEVSSHGPGPVGIVVNTTSVTEGRVSGDVVQTSAEVANLLALIECARDALKPCSAQHPDRISLCVDLGLHLWKIYKLTGSASAREEMFQVSGELVALKYSIHCQQDWAICCATLVDLLQERSEQTGDLTLLDQIVELHHEIWVSWPADSPCRAEVLAQAMRFLYGRYTQTGSVPLLVEAIEIQRQILQLHPTGHLGRGESCTTLAQLLRKRYDQTGDATLLNEMTELLQEALSLCPADHPGRSIFCRNLVVALKMSYEENGDIALLDEAIKLGSEVLILRPIGHPERSTCCGSLAMSLLGRYMHAGDPALLEKAMELQREAVDLCPKGHPEQATLLEHLAVIYQKCYNQSGSAAVLEEAVRIQRDCLGMRAVGDPPRWVACGNLAVSLRWQYDQTGDVTLLDEAIALIRETLSLLGPARDVRRAATYGNLATSLRLRYNRTGDIGLLNEVIKLQREALSLCPARHPQRARACENLAGSLSTRYSQTHDITVLTEAISLEREALALCPAGHPNRATACSDLAHSLDYLYTRTKYGAALAEAITLQREALGLYPAGHYEGALARQSLAKALRLRHYDTGDVTLLDEVIELLREALDLCPAVHPLRAVMCGSLAEALTTQYNLTNNVAIFDEIYKLQREALEHSLPQDTWRPLAILSGIHLVVGTSYFSLPDAFRCIQQSCETRTVDELQGFMIQVCPRIRLLWNFQNKWTSDITSSLVDVYAAIIDQVPMMAGFVLDTPSRLLVLKTTSEIGSDACVAAILAGQFARAIEILDHAHGIFWSQSLHPRDPQLKGAPPEIASELGSLLRAMAVPVSDLEKASRSPNSHLTAYDVRHQQNSQIQAILNQIRASPGSERFMLGSTFEELRESARNHPVVMLVNRWGHVSALIMSSSTEKNPDVLRLGIKWDDLLVFAKAAGQANVWYRTGSGDGTDSERVMRPGQHPSRQQPLEMLWTAVVKPVLSRLGLVGANATAHRPRLHWCTTGDLASVPIHAAGIYAGPSKECCSDYVVSSYTPTLSALLRARQDLRPVPTAGAKLLLVADSHTAGSSLSALWSVQKEMQVIGTIADSAGMQYAAPSRVVSTKAQATTALPSATLVHIACHGSQDSGDPLKSAFHLSNDNISVSDLMQLNLAGAYLAFLSACETAKGDHDQPDQAVHLAATMLFIGFKSIVATMWTMRDDDGPVIAKAFYEKLFESKTISGDAIPYALDHAVKKLRESGAPVERWATFIHIGA